MSPDPVTVELVRNALLTVIREMRADIVLTAFGSQIKEAEDFSCALMTATGELLGITEGTPVHLVPGTLAVRGIRERFGDNIAPGDVFMVNDPYVLSSHLNDVAFLAPHFEEGAVRQWAAVRGHYLDIGGMTLGSISPVATDIHQEGLIIPFLKLYDRGVPNEAVFDLMWSNIRLSDERALDVAAMLGAMRLAEDRLTEVIARFGWPAVEACAGVILERAEAAMRAAIRRLPDGDYAYRHFVESTRLPGVAHDINVRIAISDDAATVDFTGSSPQVSEPVNGGEATGPGAAFIALKALLDPTTPFNGGSFRPVTVVTEPGSILRASYPAACGCSSLAMYTGAVAVAGALAPAVGSAMCSHGSWGMTHTYVAGWNRTSQRQHSYFDMSTGGSAATAGQDGYDATANFDKGDFGWFVATEVIESAFPTLRVERNELWTDSGGPGAARGGLGVRRHLRLLDGPGAVTCLMDPAEIPPWGVFGGGSGAPWRVHVRRDGSALELGPVSAKCVDFPLVAGDVIEKCTMGAGGYGDPLDRDPGRVATDVAEGYVSADRARETYGVVLLGTVPDEAQTTSLRRRLRSERLCVTLNDNEATCDGSTVSTSAEARRRLGVGEGELVELVTPAAAAVRVRLAVRADLSGMRATAAAAVLRALCVHDGETAWIRALTRLPAAGGGA